MQTIKMKHWFSSEVWYLIVSIPDLCTLTYFEIVKMVSKMAAILKQNSS